MVHTVTVTEQVTAMIIRKIKSVEGITTNIITNKDI